MRIRMTAISAGPNGILDADQVVDVPDDKARELIATYHAVAAPDDKPTAKWPHGVELSTPAEKKSK
jgi:hypothetical protein